MVLSRRELWSRQARVIFEYNASSSTLQIVGSNTPFLQWSTVTTISLSGDGTTLAISYYDGGGDRKGATYVHTLNADKIWIQKGNALDGAHRHDQCGISIDLSNDGNTLAIGCFQKGKSSEYPGYAAIYKWRLGSWHQLGENIAKDGYRWFGHKVCLNEDGSIVAIGTEVYNGNNGVVEVYMWNTGELRWQQLGDKLTPEGAGWGSRFGNYAKLNSDGTILTVGCSWCVDKGSGVGAILFYKYDGSNWVHTNSFYGNRASTSAKLSGVSVNNDANVIAYNYHGDFLLSILTHPRNLGKPMERTLRMVKTAGDPVLVLQAFSTQRETDWLLSVDILFQNLLLFQSTLCPSAAPACGSSTAPVRRSLIID